jgi:ribosomal protein S18 acetylase RimI-like enzyme
VEIRFLTANDASEWWRLRLEALEGDPEAFSSSVEEHQALSQEDVRRRLGLAGTDSFVVGAFSDSRLTGVAGFHRESGPKSRHKGRVWGVYLTPEQRGTGIGRKMLQTVLERASAIEGVEQLLISVATTQIAATQLYRSLGFETFGREPRALKVGGHYIDEEHMVLRLERAVAE